MRVLKVVLDHHERLNCRWEAVVTHQWGGKEKKGEEPRTELFLNLREFVVGGLQASIQEQTKWNQESSWFEAGILTFIVYALGREEGACRQSEEQEQRQHHGGSSKNHPHCQEV
jgi:hypothetical protein